MSSLMSETRWTGIVAAGVAAGSLDVFAAAAINHVSPRIVLQAIAGGVLGKEAFAGGLATMVLGLVLQWAISIVIAAIFVLAARQLPVLSDHRFLAGLLYGLPVYAVMTFVVVPLSRATSRPNLAPSHIAADLIAMMVFGVIVAMVPAALASPTPTPGST